MDSRTLTQHFLAAKSRPVHWVALKFKRHKSWISLSWLDYFHRAEAVALGLKMLGVQPGDRVAILSNTRWEWAALDFGIQGLGAITVPIYPSSLPEEIEFIVKDCNPRVLIVEDAAQLRKWESVSKQCQKVEAVICLQGSPDLSQNLMVWDDLLDLGIQALSLHPNAFADLIAKHQLSDVATIVYTSGTTGTPKGAVLTHQQILSEVEDVARTFPVTQDDCTLSFLPYAHVLGRVELWLSTYVGYTLAFAEGIERLHPNLLEIRPTVIIGVPRIFEKIFAGIMTEIRSNPWRSRLFEWLEKDSATSAWLPRQAVLEMLVYKKLRESMGGRLRFTISGGAPLESEIAAFFHKAGVLILEGYGLTETTAAIAVNTPSTFEFGTVGRPLGEVEICLAEDGEILIKSKKVMREYYNDSKGSADQFKDGYFCTGDIGQWTEQGNLRITDRKKDLIKTSGGKYVAPQKLENLLKLDPLISNVLIHGDRKKYVVALITLDQPQVKKMAGSKNRTYRDYKSLTQSPEVYEKIRKSVARVNASLASYETIKNFAILSHDFSVESGELTPSLKVKRRLCDDRYKDVITALYEN